MSADFCALNVLGFACYATYNLAFFYSAEVQKLYKERYGADAEITVQSNDVAFAVHALLLASITLFQIGYYDGFCSRQLRPSQAIQAVIAAMLLVILVYPITIFSGSKYTNWLDYLYALSYIKITITLIKYIPQFILNFQRKCTKGWSIWNILLDFTGGNLSLFQLLFDCKDMNDFSAITGNLAKFFLGLISIVFDLAFMLQHYVLYPERNNNPDQQQEPAGTPTDDNAGQDDNSVIVSETPI